MSRRCQRCGESQLYSDELYRVRAFVPWGQGGMTMAEVDLCTPCTTRLWAWIDSGRERPDAGGGG